MKTWKSVTALIGAAMFGLVCLTPAYADFVVNASCSSQITEAFQKELMDKFMAESGVKVAIKVFPSDVCLERLRNGFCNLAGSTLPITRKDMNTGLIDIPVCRDAIAVISNPTCGVDNLSLKQVRQVFSGFVTNWKEVGGADMPIILIIPAKETGAYQNFKTMAMGPFEIRNDLCSGKTFTALTGVTFIPGSVSFISHTIATRHPDIRVIRVDGMEPVDEDYPYLQTFRMVLKGEPDAMMKEVINYILSDKAREKIIQHGMKPLM